MKRGTLCFGRAPLLLAAAWVHLLHAAGAGGEKLPLRSFNSRDGLAGDRITALLQDSRGFLWIGTDTGLSRYDGRRFTRSSTPEGLPHPVVRSLAEDALGRLWVGTSYGLALLLPLPEAEGHRFISLPPRPEPLDNLVYAVLGDGDGVLAGFGTTLLRVRWDGGSWHREVVARTAAPITALARHSSGELWLGTAAGLVRLGDHREPEVLAVSREARDNFVTSVHLDAEGRVWVATRALCAFVPGERWEAGVALQERAAWWHPRAPRPPPRAGEGPVCWGREAGIEAFRLMHVATTADGEVWLATTDGLFRIRGESVTRLDERAGLDDARTTAVLEDDAGGVWIGSECRGVMRLQQKGFVSFGEGEGLATPSAASVFWDPRFGVVVVGYPPGTAVHGIDDGVLRPVPLPIPPGTPLGWGRGQTTLVDRTGEWWVPTDGGLFHLPAVARLDELSRVKPRAVYGANSSLGSDLVFRLFEDSRGGLWVGAGGPVHLARFDRSREVFVRYGSQHGVPADTPTAFAETADGSLWIGFYRGGLGRLRGDRLEHFGEEHGIPGGFVAALLVDRRGRLWVAATRGGLGRCDDPTAPLPAFSRLTTREGLSSDGIFALVEDEEGRLWVGTQRGVDRLDPESGRVVHFSSADGLASDSVQAAARDGDGNLWFATLAGVSRLSPPFPEPPPLRSLRVLQLVADGIPFPLPEGGVTALEKIRLPVGTRHLRVAFTAVDLARGRALLFQYRLETEGQGWHSSAESDLSVLLPSHGRLTLALQAQRDGLVSPTARLSLLVPPPFWMRWWFVGLCGAALVGGAWLAHRARIAALERVARVRDRIAADLHDDLGILCSRIAILAGVGRATALDDQQREQVLLEIGDAARELLDASANVVWAVDPTADTLDSLLGRLRRLGHDLFDRDGIIFTLTAPPKDARLALPGELRREVLLIVKEALHNARRHAGPRRVELELRLAGNELLVTVADDGCGVAASAREGKAGHGMANMRRRVAAVGGRVRWESPAEGGTRVVLTIPLAGGRRRRMVMHRLRRAPRGMKASSGTDR